MVRFVEVTERGPALKPTYKDSMWPTNAFREMVLRDSTGTNAVERAGESRPHQSSGHDRSSA